MSTLFSKNAYKTLYFTLFLPENALILPISRFLRLYRLEKFLMLF